MTISPEIRDLLEAKTSFYNRQEFIESDPISIPHMFNRKEDIEIAGFLTAIISWGQRKTIINNAKKLMNMMDYDPHDFISNANDQEIAALSIFQHRTFNGMDCIYFIRSLKYIYCRRNGLESVFTEQGGTDIFRCIVHFRKVFFDLDGLTRTRKHLADPSKGASAKRINMFLRWMVRKDDHGVDFGLWKSIRPEDLYCPLDIHSGGVARKLGLLSRKQNDWKAVEELTSSLRSMDRNDPVKYDFALFGMGVFEKF
jgi:uncharacterized protein (TIGR02757 family)